MIKKIIISIILFALSGCGAGNQYKVESIVIAGSDTMFHLTQILAEQYMEENPGISIYVLGGGTSYGIKKLIEGSADICTASRELNPDEAMQLSSYYGSIGVYYLVAKDALSVYVNPENPINNLSTDQLAEIFSGQAKNWNEFGKLNAQIDVIIRPPSSGTQKYFKDFILQGEDYSSSAKVIPTTNGILKYVSEHKNAIGFGGIGFKADVKSLSVNGISPEYENARNDSYPLTRYLHFFTSRTPSGSIKNFIDWVLGSDGQKIIKEVGFIPLWEAKY